MLPKMTPQEEIRYLKAQLKEAQAREIKASLNDRITVKVGEKGNLVFYGLQKAPVSLYLNQVEKLTRSFNSPELQQFITENKEKLSVK